MVGRKRRRVGKGLCLKKTRPITPAVQTETGVAVTADNLEVARSAETILIGVKPVVVLAVVRECLSLKPDWSFRSRPTFASATWKRFRTRA